MELNILIVGDIVGRPGRMAIKELVPLVVKRDNIHFVVANGENAAGGSGITPQIVAELLSYGVHVITSGDHIWKKKEIIDCISVTPSLLRPANYPPDSPGNGYYVYQVPEHPELKIAVANILGRVFMGGVDCPFRTLDKIVSEVSAQTKIILVDVHAEATSEKIAMGWHLDGQVSCVFGTHTHIQTADETILPCGTAYITDLGMCGPYESVIGRRIDRVVGTFISGLPSAFDVAKNDVRLTGIIITVDSKTGKALGIKRVSEKLAQASDITEEETT